MPVGLAVTLRRARMWEFLDRLISIAIPRIRDFRGLNPRSFDGRGNYSMGVREQIIFPEIDYDAIDEVRGLDMIIVTTAATDVEAFALLDGLGMPFAADGRPGEVDKAAEEEEEGRKEEARQRAEAEEAALEQLKEENPEAYAKPEQSPKRARRVPRARASEGGEAAETPRPRRTTAPRARTAATTRKGTDGEDFTAGAPGAHTQVQDPRVQPLPQVRAPARRLPQVRPLPDLPARERPPGLHPRHDEVELVEPRC